MKQDQTSELSNKAKTAETEQQKTTPPTSQTNTHKTKPENISLPSSQKAGGTSKVTMRKRVRTLQPPKRYNPPMTIPWTKCLMMRTTNL